MNTIATELDAIEVALAGDAAMDAVAVARGGVRKNLTSCAFCKVGVRRNFLAQIHLSADTYRSARSEGFL